MLLCVNDKTKSKLMFNIDFRQLILTFVFIYQPISNFSYCFSYAQINQEIKNHGPSEFDPQNAKWPQLRSLTSNVSFFAFYSLFYSSNLCESCSIFINPPKSSHKPEFNSRNAHFEGICLYVFGSDKLFWSEWMPNFQVTALDNLTYAIHEHALPALHFSWTIVFI